MITYLYSICTADCATKDERQTKVLEEIAFLRGQMSDQDFDNTNIIGIPVNGDSTLGILYTDPTN